MGVLIWVCFGFGGVQLALITLVDSRTTRGLSFLKVFVRFGRAEMPNERFKMNVLPTHEENLHGSLFFILSGKVRKKWEFNVRRKIDKRRQRHRGTRKCT